MKPRAIRKSRREHQMRERRSATLPLPVLPAGLGLAGLGAGSGEAALAFLACGESSGLGTRAAGGVLWVGAAGAEVGDLGLSGGGLVLLRLRWWRQHLAVLALLLVCKAVHFDGEHVIHALGLEFGAGAELPGQEGL